MAIFPGSPFFMDQICSTQDLQVSYGDDYVNVCHEKTIGSLYFWVAHLAGPKWVPFLKSFFGSTDDADYYSIKYCFNSIWVWKLSNQLRGFPSDGESTVTDASRRRENSRKVKVSRESVIKDDVSMVTFDPQSRETSQDHSDIGVPQEDGNENDECKSFDDDHQFEDSASVMTDDSQTNRLGKYDIYVPQEGGNEDHQGENSEDNHHKHGNYFYYESPLWEETGAWKPVSIPPMSESEHNEWSRGFCTNGGFFPDEDMGWSQYTGQDKELTMRDVLLEMLLAARGKAKALASGDVNGCIISWASNTLLDQAWKDVAQTLSR